MGLTRREILKLGGLGTVAAAVSGLRVSEAGSVVQEGRDSPLDKRYLRHGLNVLCSAHASDAFFTGHMGGAFVAAYYLCREEAIEPGCADVIKAALDRHYGLGVDPYPEEAAVKDGTSKILASMEEGIDQLWRDGHNVIFLSLALRAMHDLPETVTPSRIDGIQRTIRALAPRRRGSSEIRIPESKAAFSAFVLEEFLGSTEGGPGQGFSGHLLTYGRAILDLRLLGHEAFAAKCLHAYKLAVTTARPRSPAKSFKAERPATKFVRPESKKYWERRLEAGTMELGHLFKYPYGFLGLTRCSENPALNEVCMNNSFRLFAS